jgi:photosystem II stability/assembly factor-like uncharacterized protein
MRNGKIVAAGLAAALVAWLMLTAAASGGGAAGARMRVGWVIGKDLSSTAVIVHTKNGGRTWTVQGDNTRWTGYGGNDISAVDRKTAWAALGNGSDGKILHTDDGGKTWVEQDIPGGVGPMKQIKGLSRHIAWAVSIGGTVLHTVDGGRTWDVVPHPEAPIGQVNRMDVRGRRNADIRIVDEQGGRWGMIHSTDNGATWRREFVNYDEPTQSIPGMHMVASHSRRIAWCMPWSSGELFRTRDGGETWSDIGYISHGSNDFDDMASPSRRTIWTVKNIGGDSSGIIYHVRLKRNGDLKIRQYDPSNHKDIFEGVSCTDDRHVVAVGWRAFGVPTTVPRGIIVKTTDGGKHWKVQDLPVDDVAFWKVSFVGARR